MIVAGIDVGYRVSSLSVLDMAGARPHLLECGEVKTPQEMPDEQARRIITSELRRILLGAIVLHGSPVAVGIEDYVWQGPKSAAPHAFSMCKLVGGIEHTFQDFSTLLIGKQDCNAAIGFGGKCSDRDIKHALERLFGKPVGKNEHKRDSIVCAYATGKRWRLHVSRRSL